MTSASMKDMAKKQLELEEMVKGLVKRLEEQAEKMEGQVEKIATLEKEVSILKGEQTKVVTYSGVVREAVEKVQARQERQNKVLREANLVVTGLEDAKDETEDGTKGKVEEALQKGMRLPPSGHGEVQQAVRLKKYAEGKKRPVLVKCKSSTSAGVILKSRSNLKDAEGFEEVFVNPDRTPEEREKVRKAVVEMKKLRKENKEAYVTLQGDLVVVGEGGERRRTSFASTSPWAAEAAATRNLKEMMKEVGEQPEESFVEVTRRGRGRKTGSAERAETPASRA